MTPEFRPSSMCQYNRRNYCVEVATNLTGKVLVRNSSTGNTVEFDDEEWTTFLDGAKKGEFDVKR
ncbi:DUF397 domain-containing protein [Nocardiopsis sp. FIRDI 009]|uniref:DUF397 domain-containing protein n=1 Tax=Nocardiopsis sp. FIRDI 009 TaxID=714197 RepID=UPI000E26CDE9|nr:DUF397 domain-containing protein [Nocardiopsis sp. FIRDI 009]